MTTNDDLDVASELSPEADPRYQAAREHAEQLQGLLIHVLVYVVINLGLFIIDALTGGGWWFYWALLGWGVALAVHVLVVFAPVFSSDWVDRQARRTMESEHR